MRVPGYLAHSLFELLKFKSSHFAVITITCRFISNSSAFISGKSYEGYT